MTTVVLNTVTRKVEVFSSARDVQARAEITDHKAAADPHPQYLADADVSDVALSGNAGDLIAGTVPDARMPNWTGYNVASRTALEAANIQPAVDAIRINGFTSAGDGGGARYKRAASEPSHEGKIQSADGAWWELAETRPTPQMFGALADGSNDDLEAINRCGAFVDAKGLGLLYLPNGTYRVKDSATGAAAAPDIGFVGIVIYDGMTIRGQSREGTIVKSADGFGRRLITARDEEASFDIEDLTLDGNRSTHADGTQGIRLWSRNLRVGIRNVTSRNNGSYGFGVGWDPLDIATNIELFASEVLVENNGTDGCDAKITKRAFLDRVIARNNGAAGIDVRGHYVVMSGCLASGNALWGISSGRDTSDGTGIAHHQSINCISHDNVQMGFRFRDSAATTAEIVEFRLTNPISYGNSQGAGIIAGRGNIVITGGAFYENTTYGIAISDTAAPGGYPDPTELMVEVNGTAVRDNVDHAILCTSDFPARLAVTGGLIKAAAGKRGISGGFSSLRCIGVRFEGGDQGVNWNKTSGNAENGEIAGCVFDGQAGWGFSANAFSTGVMIGCTFRSAFGFRALASALDWFLVGNDFSGVTTTEIEDSNNLVAVVGLDTADTDIQLSPKSAGYVRFGTHSALGAEALSGYIEIKDAGGTVRKVAVVS